MALISAILKQTYRKTDLMRASERQMDAGIGIFGSFGVVECMSEPFDHMEHRSYLSTSAFAMQTASRTHVSECAAPAIRTCQKGLIKPQMAQRLHFWHPMGGCVLRTYIDTFLTPPSCIVYKTKRGAPPAIIFDIRDIYMHMHPPFNAKLPPGWFCMYGGHLKTTILSKFTKFRIFV